MGEWKRDPTVDC